MRGPVASFTAVIRDDWLPLFFSLSLFLYFSPVIAAPALDARAVAERRSKIVTVGNESISSLCLTHWYFYCRWVVLHSSHLNYNSWRDTRHSKSTRARTHTHSPIQILALIKKQKTDSGKMKAKAKIKKRKKEEKMLRSYWRNEAYDFQDELLGLFQVDTGGTLPYYSATVWNSG